MDGKRVRGCGAHGRLQTRTFGEQHRAGRVAGPAGVERVLSRTCERVSMATGGRAGDHLRGVTSLEPEPAGPGRVEALWCWYWGIEDRAHYVRDVTMGAGAGRAYTGGTPQAMAAIRNCIVGLLRYCGWKSVADALRHYGAHPDRALVPIGAATPRL